MPVTSPIQIGGRSDANEPVVTEIERQSPLWKKITAHLEARVKMLRARNDGDRSETKTAKLRGQIVEVKHLLALDKPAPAVEADDA